jgi:hypothetical protein
MGWALLEDDMRDSWRNVVLAIVVLTGGEALAAEQMVTGKLERVDLDTVTVCSRDNRCHKLEIDKTCRMKAAPFLGKSVLVDVKNENGAVRAISFRSATP